MTKDEFQRQYNDYMTLDKAAAAQEAEKVCAAGVDVVAVKFGEHWCLMLRGAAAFALGIGIDGEAA